MNNKERLRFGLAILFIALSRVPFLFYGYGSEEDAWALPLVTERIAESGIYEVSRLPGHPFQELFYTAIWNSGSVIYNLVTLIISSAGIAFFMLALRKLELKQWITGGIALAFTPIVYINSCNDLDYTWAMAFVLISFYLLLKEKPVAAGLLIAMAIASRITSGAMLLPFTAFLLLCKKQEYNTMFTAKFLISAVIFTLLIFIPVFKNYGLSFFTYYEHFPIPSFAKNFYKGSLAVWGLPGFIAIGIACILLFSKKRFEQKAFLKNVDAGKALFIMSLLTIVLYMISFCRLPLKAAFMIPLIPFLWIIFLLFLKEKSIRFLTVTICISAFFFGINLSDPLRGSKESSLSIPFLVSGQKVVFDVLSGPVIADISKRIQRTQYAENVLAVTEKINKPTYIIAGWWLADLLVLQRGKENSEVTFGYYTDEDSLKNYSRKNYEIFYLPEQEIYNDRRYRKEFTLKYAKLLSL